jgi:hypothetical protein
MSTTINDLQTKYDINRNQSYSGNTVIQQQINYINDLKAYINNLNQGIIKGCITSIPNDLDTIDCSYNGIHDASCNTICNNVNDYKTKIQVSGNSYVNFANYKSGNSANTDYDAIMTNNAEIKKLRNELDLKLKDLNKTSDSSFKNYEDNYNYELMMNITWSILATSIIYYVFVKL